MKTLFALMLIASSTQAFADAVYQIECKDLPYKNMTYLRIEQIGIAEYSGAYQDASGKMNYFTPGADEVNAIYTTGVGTVGMDLSSIITERNKLITLRFDGKAPQLTTYFVNPGTFEKLPESASPCTQTTAIGVDKAL